MLKNSNTCNNIKQYGLFQVVRQTFEWVVLQEDIYLLQLLLGSTNPTRFTLAKSYITTTGLSDDQVNCIFKSLVNHSCK